MATEAVFAAVYLDGGIGAASDLIHRCLLDAEKEEAVEERRRDYKTALQELVQRTPGVTITYELVQESGPDHCRVFEMEVAVGGKVAGRGQGHSKKEAEQAAARAALESMRKQNTFDTIQSQGTAEFARPCRLFRPGRKYDWNFHSRYDILSLI